MYRPDEIPIIAVGGLLDGSDVAGVSRALCTASRDVGFMYIVDHGLAPSAIESLRMAAHRFFDQTHQHKMQVEVSAAHRGFLSVGGAVMSEAVAPDAKESFIWGHEFTDRGAQARSTDHSLRGTNQWPVEVPELRAAAEEFLVGAGGLATRLLTGFALGLGLPANQFHQLNDFPLSRASAVHYPSQPDDAVSLGSSAHTDFGVLTLLAQDDVGGLQVRAVDGRWIDAPPVDGALVVNVGDLLSRWTGGQFRSTQHRVVSPTESNRVSLVLAFDPNPETVVDASALFDGDDLFPPPTTVGDYLTWRFGKAFRHRS